MTEHISQADLNALADGELSTDQLAFVNDHLAACPACTSAALGADFAQDQYRQGRPEIRNARWS